MEEDTESWVEDMIEGKINPKYFGIRCYKTKSVFFMMYGQVL